MTQKLTMLLTAGAVLFLSSCQQPVNPKAATKHEASKYFDDPVITHKVDSVLSMMTLDEKIGQLTLYSSGWDKTGPSMNENYINDIKAGKCGNIFNAFSPDYNRKLQKIAMEQTRMKIPLLFGYDVIHGQKTIFPIPLGEAASWDLKSIQKTASAAAAEAAAAGIQWTYAPMCDIARDPRWGRVSEGAGEDPYLGSKIAAARVHGFQGTDLASDTTVVACVKHFAAYGAPEAGRDYNTVDMSERKLRDVYLPPYKAAVDAGAGTVMTSFNDLNGVPATASHFLMTDILRKEWGFNGFVVTDYTAINELVPHGIAKDEKDAAALAMNAGVDMDMQGGTYSKYLKELLKEGRVTQEEIDNAVRRLLRIKFRLGLFADPYKYFSNKREKKLTYSKYHMTLARQMARESMVLLKNDKETLPLKNGQRIALIGPLANSQRDLLGSWHAAGDWKINKTVKEAMEDQFGRRNIQYAKGCDLRGDNRSGFAAAVSAARRSDVVVMVLGESAEWSGEAASRAHINLPHIQSELLEAIHKTGKPLVVVLMSGRPLALDKEVPMTDAMLEAWFPGTEGAPALADVLSGKYNPSGKLPMTFPRITGQIPIYYSAKNTGRPYTVTGKEQKYRSRYLFTPNTPEFAFGHGLSYTTFSYSAPKLSTTKLEMGDTLHVSATITNTGNYDGTEVAQLYIRDMVGSVTRPVKELKGFRRIFLKKGESKTVNFDLTMNDLSFYRKDMTWGAEPGDFKVFVGGASDDVKETAFTLVK